MKELEKKQVSQEDSLSQMSDSHEISSGFTRKISESQDVSIRVEVSADKTGYLSLDESEEQSSDKRLCNCFAEADEKKTVRTAQTKKKMLNRLRRIEGQVRGLEAMLERDAYCNDILQQSAAVNAAINAFNRELISNHMKHCVARDLRDGKDEVIDELVSTLQKLMK